MHAHSFKLGFCFKLAEARVPASLVFERLSAVKLAGKGPKEKKEKQEGEEDVLKTHELAGPAKALGIYGGGAIAASGVLPTALGKFLGGYTATGLDQSLDTTDELRTRYLIKRYRDFIRERQTMANNRMISEALR